MQISPKLGMYAFGVVSVIAAAGVGIFPQYIPNDIAKDIVQTCSFIVAIVSGLASASHAFSSAQSGPLVPPAPPANGGQ